jgi:predicted RNase H-like HicB family nuclease
MQIPVLIEPIADAGFRARSGEPLSLVAEGSTREEALGKLRHLLETKLQNGSELMNLQMGVEVNPWLRGAGLFADDEQFQEWQAVIEENRRKLDEEEGMR